MGTPRYRVSVCPTLTPAPSVNAMVIVGPACRRWSYTRKPATIAPQPGEPTRPPTPASAAAGRGRPEPPRPPRARPSRALLGPLPDLSRIEARRRENRQHDDGGEGEEPASRHHGGQLAQLHERDEDRQQKHVEHGPGTDDIERPVDPHPCDPPARRSHASRDHQEDEGPGA